MKKKKKKKNLLSALSFTELNNDRISLSFLPNPPASFGVKAITTKMVNFVPFVLLLSFYLPLPVSFLFSFPAW